VLPIPALPLFLAFLAYVENLGPVFARGRGVYLVSQSIEYLSRS